MFTDTKVSSAFAVDDLAQARKFYGETLGVRVSGQHGLLTLHLAGDRDIGVYPKPPPGSRTRPETSLRCCRSGSASSA
jgi:catechol 2,3-dioxygenase-like lactoylglutathione lyase family enzyme